ncbi:ABC transporter ATP-binding protein [Paramaledivibacter caminithermalis]|uniref:Putative ABC transport system ATP-binding protein n=1 Tax=Paramaledivibacter caminithermalis (strain DSM 15212 / CIP 107654 / DViRD3) TaxID=1121301 RepID=A0A1M6TIY7_PARC5|nr:ABC transporter ATP-binding protein [Paramaledivibacter caminithermalis]SHK56856.1 putative ABC transport system ATP-binding protein [Paramaledivibacter caminithermalis DSM 15212]
MNKPIIEMRDIRKTYETGALKVEVLKGISLTVENGEFISIIGASGSGKSTLMNIMGCLDTCTSGEYILDSKDINSYSEKELATIRSEKIGFIFQKFNLLSKMSAYENVELPLLYKGIEKKERKRRVLESLEIVGLDDRQDHRPTELSGGQQQRVAIARAIAGKPPLILADEPTGNLDSKSTEDIMNILLDLNKSGTPLVLITHDNDIAKLASRIIRISDGQIIKD